MSKFYFNVLQGSGVAEDMKGTELPGLEEAKAMAQVTARELLANAIKGGNQNPPEIVTISDESGQKLGKIALRGVLPEPLK